MFICVYACVHEDMCLCVWIHVHVCLYVHACVHMCVYVSVYLTSTSERQAQVISRPASAKWSQASLYLPCQSHPISQGDASPGWCSQLRVLLNTQMVPSLFLVLTDSRGGKWVLSLLRNSKFIPSSVTTGRSKCYKALQNNQQSWTEHFWGFLVCFSMKNFKKEVCAHHGVAQRSWPLE